MTNGPEHYWFVLTLVGLKTALVLMPAFTVRINIPDCVALNLSLIVEVVFDRHHAVLCQLPDTQSRDFDLPKLDLSATELCVKSFPCDYRLNKLIYSGLILKSKYKMSKETLQKNR
jgi:hypothetical protein